MLLIIVVVLTLRSATMEGDVVGLTMNFLAAFMLYLSLLMAKRMLAFVTEGRSLPEFGRSPASIAVWQTMG